MANVQNNEPSKQVDVNPSTEVPPQATEGEEEFKITVKKLDFVVKPRGVLAE